jgi:hypothetical protein
MAGSVHHLARPPPVRKQKKARAGRSDLDWPTDRTVVFAAFSTAAFE